MILFENVSELITKQEHARAHTHTHTHTYTHSREHHENKEVQSVQYQWKEKIWVKLHKMYSCGVTVRRKGSWFCLLDHSCTLSPSQGIISFLAKAPPNVNLNLNSTQTPDVVIQMLYDSADTILKSQLWVYIYTLRPSPHQVPNNVNANPRGLMFVLFMAYHSG